MRENAERTSISARLKLAGVAPSPPCIPRHSDF